MTEALAVKDGKILAVGAKADVLKTKGDATKLVDLAGKTLIPGFVDGHSHFSQVAIQAISTNLLPPPDGPATSIPQIQEILREYIATSPCVKQFGVAIGFEYDDPNSLNIVTRPARNSMRYRPRSRCSSCTSRVT